MVFSLYTYIYFLSSYYLSKEKYLKLLYFQHIHIIKNTISKNIKGKGSAFFIFPLNVEKIIGYKYKHGSILYFSKYQTWLIGINKSTIYKYHKKKH